VIQDALTRFHAAGSLVADYFDADGLPASLCDLLDSVVHPWELKQPAEQFLRSLKKPRILGEVHPTATISGPVHIESGALVEAGASITGPVYIFSGARIGHSALVRDNSIIGPDTEIGHCAEVARSIFLRGSRALHFVFAGDSVVGSYVNIGSSCVFSNLLVDEPVRIPAVKEIAVLVEGRRVNTGYTKFGSIVGDRTQTASHLSFNPGTLIGKNVVIHSRSQMGGHIPSSARIRT
jgi:UDP-N-acetylglucosamine diphosphorylase / glucose-1-phosphate thymidylyltransferase / UDP-N-acetylgalactosamine diphosphorylase / glucosamine-1-phosphate N-acetyltransferase / galactosamine-1-phosphate N-acetyltransferase